MKLSKRVFEWAVFSALRWVALLARYFSWRLGVRIGGRIGVVLYYLLRGMRQQSIENLRISYGRDQSARELSHIVKRNFRNLGKSLIEVLNLKNLKPRQIDSLVSIEGEEYLKEALKRGNAVVLMTGHVGNWELMVCALAARGYPLNVMAAPFYSLRIDEWIIKLRLRFKIKTISRGSSISSKTLLGVLHRKGILGLLIDLDAYANGSDLFNRKAYTPVGAARLALQSGAVAMVFAIVRLPCDRHRITIHKPITFIRTADYEKDVKIHANIITGMIETYVKQYPDQLLQIHRRWKTTIRDANQ